MQTDHNPAPWTDELAPLVVAGDDRVKINGGPPRVAVRLLAEENFQFAKHRVNAYEALVETLSELCDIVQGLVDEGLAPRHVDGFTLQPARNILGRLDGMAVHHIDGNPHNNTPANLRLVSIKENRG